MARFEFPASTVHLAGSPKGNHMDVWFLPHGNGQDFLIITEWGSGTVESAWGFDSSIAFHRHCGLKPADTPPSDRVISIASRRLTEADEWPVIKVS